MKFDRPRVFERIDEVGTRRLVFHDDVCWIVSTVVSGPHAGALYGAKWTFNEMAADPGWCEVTPPITDITKLDTAGVFHEKADKAPVMRHYYRKDDPDYILSNPGPLIDRQSQFIEFPRPDIANATIAELRRLLRLAVKDCERNSCHHENTVRGGAIWTICEDCGRKWADDRGGFKPYKEPKWLMEATALLADEVRA